MPRGVSRRQSKAANVRTGFCVSCGTTRSSRFRPASEKWKMFYNELPNLKENHKRGNPRICNACYGGLYPLSSDHTSEPVEDEGGRGGGEPNNVDIAVVKLDTKPIVKRSSIGGNGLFAERDYEKGEFVAAYGGRILSRDETEGKDQSYFKVIGVDKHNGIIDGKYDFGDTLGRYINTPIKGKHPNCRWYGFDPETQTITIKTNKEVKCGQEFTVRYSPPIRQALQARKKRGRWSNEKKRAEECRQKKKTKATRQRKKRRNH